MLVRSVVVTKSCLLFPMSRKALLGVIFVVLVAIGGVILVTLKTIRTEPERVVKIGYFNQHLGSVPLFLAQDKGQFTKQGVKVELVPMASSNLATEALVRGDIDLGLISMIPVLNAETKDPGKIKLVSASVISRDGSFDRVLVKADSGIESLSDPKIQKVAVFPGTTATNFLKDVMKRQGIDVSKIEFVQMPPSNQLPALQSGTVQAAHMLEPTVSLTLSQGGYKAITQSIYGGVFDKSPIGGIGISAKFAADHPALAKQVVLAIHESSAYELVHPDEARAIITTKFNVAPEVAAKMDLLPFARFEDLAPNFLESFVDTLVNMGELQARPNVRVLIYKAS